MKLNSLIVLCIVCVSILLNACRPGKSEDHTTEISLRVMTYNIHHANPPSKAEDSVIDVQAIADVIKKAEPDLVALQEVDVYNARSGVELHQAKALAELTGMHYYFTRAIYYRGGAYGNAVLSRYPIIDSASYQLPVIDSNAKAETRALCMIKISLPEGGPEIFFASTHLDQYKDETNRLQQAHKIVDIVKDISLPVIIGGDFNALPGSKTIQFLDSTFTRSCTANCPFTFPGVDPSRTIDYVIYRPADKIYTREVTAISEPYASDHLPVVAEINLEYP